MKKCLNCGIEFDGYKTSKYCSETCRRQHAYERSKNNSKLTKICPICGKEFSYPKWRENKAKFCSIKCQRLSLHGELNCKCDNCGKMFHKKESSLNIKHGNFCSMACYAEKKKELMKGEKNHQFGLRGPLNASFKDYELKSQNNTIVDIWVYVEDHPFSYKNRVLKHRLLVEQHHTLFDEKYFITINGHKYLNPEYHVHHIDFNHNNNDINNLQIVTKSEHTSIHNKNKKIIRNEKGRITGVKKLGELLENLEVDNQQLSYNGNIVESSETSNRDQMVSNITTSAQHNQNCEDIVRTACITSEDAESSDKEQMS